MIQTKRCPRCGETKPREAFNVSRGRPDGMQTACRLCQQSTANARYKLRSRKHQASVLLGQAGLRERNREYVDRWLATHPCVDCGEADRVCLEFDHVRGAKTKPVSELAAGSYSLARIQREIDKCEVRCCNCHRKITHRRREAERRAKELKAS
ncbi:hypothetical protein [Tsukamurella paurometabola]|uniref:HNH endonuclease n=1 Tax=Tsukamurella paurometabola TaxID=2061 RepID=A0ABS5NET3_TSUPA|nr:hypothetical protein [Tsukamurella paurometabola]MBS4102780.1 hypothetical protein [Tsukamurella paurometabola]